GRVDVRTYAKNGHVMLEVADKGIGIPVSEQHYVFERFFRGSNAAERVIPGTGLGLSIAKMIVDTHGGSITFESDEGEGTTFRIELPLETESAGGRADRAEVA
ncbi:MAG: ATP-binding protein, partial [Gaiellaceae bacterium]